MGEKNRTDCAILVAGFGTSFPEARKAGIDPLVKRIGEAFPGCETRLAYTSPTIVRKLKALEGEAVESVADAFEALHQDGYHEVIVQPLHVVPGLEFKKLMQLVRRNKTRFGRVSVGRPLLYFSRGEDLPDDYRAVVEAMVPALPDSGSNRAVLMMSHGTPDPANACYAFLERTIHEAGHKQIYLASVEGAPYFDDVLPVLCREKPEEVTLLPFMVVAGDHARNDMSGPGPNSWESRLKAKGMAVQTLLTGLGENPAIGGIYAAHALDAAAGRYEHYLEYDLD
ncbi:MAG: sirohydrochlorin cobaltochelatase [Solirubrobacterales bacterium]